MDANSLTICWQR